MVSTTTVEDTETSASASTRRLTTGNIKTAATSASSAPTILADVTAAPIRRNSANRRSIPPTAYTAIERSEKPIPNFFLYDN